MGIIQIHVEMYNLQGNDDCIVSFTKEELEYCSYPQSIFIDWDGEVEEGRLMPIHCMTGAELEALREFLRIRVRLGEDGKIQVRDIKPKLFNSNIMNKDGKTPTGYRLVTWEPLVTCDNMPLWMPHYNGIANEYHMWLEGAVKQDRLFYWLEAADYVGCKDLVYLLQVYCAYLYVHMVGKYMKGVGACDGKVAGFREWVAEERDDNRREHQFMKGFDTLMETHPIMCEQIMKRFVRHRGIRLPRVEWTDADWEGFYRDAPEFYRKLPITEKERAGLYV